MVPCYTNLLISASMVCSRRTGREKKLMADKWTDRTVQAIDKLGMHRDPQSAAKIEKGALYLGVKEGGARSWYYRYQLNRKRRKMGLGRYPAVGLSEARNRARQAAARGREGIDPIDSRRANMAKTKMDALSAETFKSVAEAFLKRKQAGWKNPKHRQQWENTLKTYAYPTIGDLPVQLIDTNHILIVLDPIWTTKTETAVRVRQRIQAVLDAAKSRGLREGDNPAEWRGNLEHHLAKPSDVREVRHHPALPYDLMNEFMEALRQRKGVAAKALEYTILTASRVGTVFKAQWSEIDIEKRVWTCPADHMKRKKEHRVPLNDDAVSVLLAMKEFRESDFIFPSIGTKRGLSNGAMDSVLDRMRLKRDWPEMSAHGFRSTFTNWAQDKAPFPLTVAEAALHHIVGDKVTQAYARSDVFDKRGRLMGMWADFCSRPFSDETAEVISLHGDQS